MSGDGNDGIFHHSELEETQCRDRMKSCPMLLALCCGKLQPLHPFSQYQPDERISRLFVQVRQFEKLACSIQGLPKC